ncbi:MAG: hypothetical protein R3F44_01465 [Candidatus Competibacteraceae bacterium]
MGAASCRRWQGFEDLIAMRYLERVKIPEQAGQIPRAVVLKRRFNSNVVLPIARIPVHEDPKIIQLFDVADARRWTLEMPAEAPVLEEIRRLVTHFPRNCA